MVKSPPRRLEVDAGRKVACTRNGTVRGLVDDGSGSKGELKKAVAQQGLKAALIDESLNLFAEVAFRRTKDRDFIDRAAGSEAVRLLIGEHLHGLASEKTAERVDQAAEQ